MLSRMTGYEAVVRIKDIDHANASAPQEWTSEANPRSTPHEAGLVKRLLDEHVRTEYVELVKQSIAESIRRLTMKARASAFATEGATAAMLHGNALSDAGK